jgi:hypothetical protein
MSSTKVIFNGLGPAGVFHYENVDYKDGMVADLPVDVAIIVVHNKYAIEHTEVDQNKIDKKLAYEDKKRKEISKKVEALNEGGK